MGRPRKIENIYNPQKSKTQFSEGQKSKGILDDYATRKSMNTREGTITKTPVADYDIANKKYVDDNAGGGGITNLDGGASDSDFGGIAISPIDGGDST